jgi:hypothetical protein
MSNRNAFESLREQLTALPRSEIRLPDMPVEQAIREAEIMHSAAVEDAEALAKVGIHSEVLDSLDGAIGALRFTQAQYIAALGELKESAREWVRLLPEAKTLRHELLATLSFATRHIPDATRAIKRIREGVNAAHIVQDLLTLSELGKKYPETLEGLHFDMSELDRAAEMSKRMSHLYARAFIERGSTLAKILRDAAYTLMRRQMNQVMVSAEFVFRKQRERLEFYHSQFRSRRHAAASRVVESGSAQASPTPSLVAAGAAH